MQNGLLTVDIFCSVYFSVSVTKESLLDVQGYVRTTDIKVESCTQQDVELHVEQVQ